MIVVEADGDDPETKSYPRFGGGPLLSFNMGQSNVCTSDGLDAAWLRSS